MIESQTTEFKASWRDEYLKSISAFANTNGGKLLIGFDDRGNPIGVRNSKKLLEDIPNKIINKLGITPSVELIKEQNKEIICISVQPAPTMISYNGKHYIRCGSTTQEVNGTELSQLILKKAGKTWDSLFSEVGLENINEKTVDRFRELANNKISSISKSDSINKIFSNLDLINNDKKIKNAALLLFGNNPQNNFISAKSRVGRFKSSINIADTVIAEGNIFNQLEIVLEAIKKHLNVKFEIKDIQRKDVWDYPLEAIREAVINSLIHKDYLSTAEIQIKIYDDKIWIWNPGKLPSELKVDDLKKDHSSYPRNPLIANVFYLAGYIERWGSGTKRIVDLCKEQGLPEPEYKEEQGGFSVWFFKDIYSEEILQKIVLNERQIKAVLYVKEKGKITNKEYQQICSVKKRQTTDDLKELENMKIFERIGTTGKGTYYKLKGAPKGHNGH
ncbi:MAG: ATP-binding protein [Atribacterota bacterium]|nr:ATP-binding protein [Atribacterota bacterium]